MPININPPCDATMPCRTWYLITGFTHTVLDACRASRKTTLTLFLAPKTVMGRCMSQEFGAGAPVFLEARVSSGTGPKDARRERQGGAEWRRGGEEKGRRRRRGRRGGGRGEDGGREKQEEREEQKDGERDDERHRRGLDTAGAARICRVYCPGLDIKRVKGLARDDSVSALP